MSIPLKSAKSSIFFFFSTRAGIESSRQLRLHDRCACSPMSRNRKKPSNCSCIAFGCDWRSPPPACVTAFLLSLVHAHAPISEGDNQYRAFIELFICSVITIIHGIRAGSAACCRRQRRDQRGDVDGIRPEHGGRVGGACGIFRWGCGTCFVERLDVGVGEGWRGTTPGPIRIRRIHRQRGLCGRQQLCGSPVTTLCAALRYVNLHECAKHKIASQTV